MRHARCQAGLNPAPTYGSPFGDLKLWRLAPQSLDQHGEQAFFVAAQPVPSSPMTGSVHAIWTSLLVQIPSARKEVRAVTSDPAVGLIDGHAVGTSYRAVRLLRDGIDGCATSSKHWPGATRAARIVWNMVTGCDLRVDRAPQMGSSHRSIVYDRDRRA